MKFKKEVLLLTILPLLLTGCNNKGEQQTTPTTDDSGQEIIVEDKASSEGLVYQFADAANSSYKVIAYKGNATHLVIPDTYRDKPVVEIDHHAFKNNLVIKEITIGKNIAAIGAFAFSRTFNLNKINLKDNSHFELRDGLVFGARGNNAEKDMIIFGEAHRYEYLDATNYYIQPGAFGNFENLFTLEFNYGKLVRWFAYSGTSGYYSFASLFNGEAGNAKYSVDKMKNYYVPNISSVVFKSSINTTLDSYFFQKCKTLINVKFIIDGNLILGSNVFQGCVSLREFDRQNVNGGVTLGNYSFSDTISLEKYWVGSSDPTSGFSYPFYGTNPNAILFIQENASIPETMRKIDDSSLLYYRKNCTYDEYEAYSSLVGKIDLSAYDDFAPAKNS